LRVLFVSLFIVITDQLTKFLIKGGIIPVVHIQAKGMGYGQSINVFGDFLKLTFVENPGIAFGIDVGDTSKLFLSLFSLIAAIGILYYLWKSKDQKLVVRFGLVCILGGAIGNLIDRTFYGVFYNYAPIFYGKVVDFINVDFFDFTIFGRTYDRFPIFNIADSSVTIGVILLILFHRTIPEEEKKEITSPDVEIQTSASASQIIGKAETVDNINPIKAERDGENSNREEIKN
jgi:signal peptidase II